MFPFTGMYEKGTYVLSLNQVLNLFVLDVLFRPSNVKYVHILGMFSFSYVSVLFTYMCTYVNIETWVYSSIYIFRIVSEVDINKKKYLTIIRSSRMINIYTQHLSFHINHAFDACQTMCLS